MIKNNAILIDKLTALGLHKKEALVYLDLLRRDKEVGSSKIITSTKLHGQYVYNALYSLEERGLVKHVVKNGRKKFSANHPRRLVSLVEEKRFDANELQDLLQNQYVLKDQEFEVFQGGNQLVAHSFQMIEEAEQGDSLDIMGGQGSKFSELVLDRDLRIGYSKMIRDKNVSIRYIGSMDQGEYLKRVKLIREKFDYCTIPNLPTSMVSTLIRPKSISFQIYGEPILMFTIKNEMIAKDYRSFFEVLWELYTQNSH